jgi:hypothetical protein
MNNTLELRSTFRPSETLTEIPNLTKNKFTFSPNQLPNAPLTLEPTLRKNKNTVANSIVKKIKDSLDSEMQAMLEPYVTTRLSTAVRKQFDSQDNLSLNTDTSELVGFELGAIKKICNRFRSKCFIRKCSQKGEVIFDLPGFVPYYELNAPEEATNFKISSKLIAVSNFRYDNNLEAYSPLSEDIHGLNDGYESPMMPLIKIETQPITAKLYIDKMKTNSDKGNTVMIIAIKYYKYWEGKFQYLEKNGCMSISQIF